MFLHVCFWQLLVAQKDGTIRFLSLSSQQPIMSLSCGVSPLLDCDWSRHNSLLVGAVAGTDWILFDTSRSRYAKGVGQFCGAKSYFKKERV
jgi:nuclear pore complex protein Nup37